MPNKQLLFFIAGTKSLDHYIPALAGMEALNQTQDCLKRLREANAYLSSEMFTEEASRIASEYGDLGTVLLIAFYAGMGSGATAVAAEFREGLSEKSA